MPNLAAGVTSRAISGLVVVGPLGRSCAPPRGESHHGLGLQGEIGQHRPHGGLVDQLLVEHAAVPGMVHGERQPHPHEAGRGHGAVEAR